MIYCIHHNDPDGRCSAAIVRLMYEGERLSLIEADYNMDMLPSIAEIKTGDTVYIVDFSLQPKVMNELRKIVQFPIWIDHHVTAKDYPYQTLPGLRNFNDKEESGCELTWRFFNIGKVPKAVMLIGDYDKWALKTAPVCFQLYEGLKLENQNPASDMWKELFENDETCERIIEQGKSAIRYRDNYCSEMRKSFGHEVEFDGHMAYALNTARFGSQAFGDMFSMYPFCVMYIYDGDKYTVSLYSEKVDVGAICKAHGGGGHKGAAGFTCKELPFKKVGA